MCAPLSLRIDRMQLPLLRSQAWTSMPARQLAHQGSIVATDIHPGVAMHTPFLVLYQVCSLSATARRWLGRWGKRGSCAMFFYSNSNLDQKPHT